MRASYATVIAGVAAIYLIQAATPLRLDDDSLDYLRVAAAITDGIAVPTLPIPLGYSRLLSLIERSGFATSTTFVIVNCVSLLIGLLSVWWLRAYTVKSRQLAILATLLAIPVVKSAVMPLPDATFFGTSLLAVCCVSFAIEAEGLERYALLILAAILTIAAISLRYAGIALIPPLALSVFQKSPSPDRSTKRRSSRMFQLAAFLLVAVAFVALWSRSRIFSLYVRQALGYYSQGPVQLLDRAMVVVRSFGEVMVNLPFSRLRLWGALFVVAGVLFGAAFVLLVRWRAALTPARIYLACYLVMLVLWPFPAPRLWMPIIPLIFAEAVEGFIHIPRPRWMRVAAGSYGCWFALTGIAALAYTTRISLSGEKFPQIYGRSGGMADPRITEGNRSFSRVQLYNAEAGRVRARYGRR